MTVATEIQASLSQYEPRITVTEVLFSGTNENFKIDIQYELALANGQNYTDSTTVETNGSGY